MLEIEEGAALTAIGIMSSAAAHIWRRVEWIPELSAMRRERKPPGHPGAVEKQDPDTANARVANSTRNSCIAASEVCFLRKKKGLEQVREVILREGRFFHPSTTPKAVRTLYLVSPSCASSDALLV